MKKPPFWFCCVMAFWLGAMLVAFAQEKPAPPVLTIEETVMVEAVQALQKQAQAACETLGETKAYAALVTKANRALKAKGKAVNWNTGAVSAVESKP